MAAKFDLSNPGAFKVLGQHTNLSKAWEQYVSRFEIYIQPAGVTKDVQKRALLLHVGGPEVQDVFDSLGSPGTTYNDAVDSLNAYFKPKKRNIQYERHVFHQCKQLNTETIDNYVVRMLKLSVSCEFQDPEDQVRDHALDSCTSDELRKKLLTTKNLTLERLQEVAGTFELSDTHAKLMSRKQETLSCDEAEVNKLRAKSKPGSSRKPINQPRPQRQQNNQRRPQQQPRQLNNSTARCYRCGDIGHYGRQCVKSNGITCHKCGGLNHFAKMCKSKHVNFLKTNYSDGYSCEEIFTLSGKNEATLRILIQGKSVDILIDSGSSVNIIDKNLLDKLKTKQTALLPSCERIFPYSSTKHIPLIGKTNLNVAINNAIYNVEFQVLKGTGKPLLGQATACRLGLLHIGPLPEQTINSLKSVKSESEILSEYKDRFRGLGRLKNFKLKLHVDESVQPVAQAVRRVPFMMKKQIENKIDELERLDIIEGVEGPTLWVSNLVPIPKKDNDVRYVLT